MHDLLQGDDPSAGGAQPILPPVTDGLVTYIDCGVLSCWDNEGEVAFDLAGLEGDNNFLRNNAADLPFIGTPGTRASVNHWLSDGTQLGFLEAEAPLASSKLLHSGDFGVSTVIAVINVPAGTPSEATLLGPVGSNGDTGCAYQLQSDGSRHRSRINNGNATNSGVDMGSPWGIIGPSAQMLTWVVDSNDDNLCNVRLNGQAKFQFNGANGSTNNDEQPMKIFGVPQDNRLPLGTKFYAYLYYNRILTDQEIIDLENFFLPFLALPEIINGYWRVINETLTNGGAGAASWSIFEIEFQIATAIQPVTAPFSLLDPWDAPEDAFDGDVSNDRNVADTINDIVGIRQAAIGAAFGETKNIDLVRINQGPRQAPTQTVTGVTVQSSDDQGQTWRDRGTNLSLDPNGGVFDEIVITP